MNKKLYDMMDWARIEGLVYSEENDPHDFLGAHVTKEGVLFQIFIPSAVKIEVCVDGTKKVYPMEVEDEAGFFAVLIPGKSVPKYHYHVTYDNGSEQEFYDPYSFAPQISKETTRRFNEGVCWDIYEMLGAHEMTIDGISGTYFAVWAPNALRVSVVGDFNLWDGRKLPMRRLWDSGIFELFIPELPAGTIYKYEIKAKGGLTYLKADPYASAAEMRPHTASVVANLTDFAWTDQAWVEKRASFDIKTAPVSIYEVHLGSWKRPAEGDVFYNYRELAPMLADYVLDMGYTHVELMPIMEHPFDGSWGYQTTGYFAPTARYGSPEDFMFMVNYLHEKGIGVILDWSAASFPRDTFGLSGFDGTCLYEHLDPRQGTNPHAGTCLYNYGRPEVKNFLISSALYWTKVFHADGIRVASASAILYLDYDKRDGEWISNIYGGNENLEGVSFLKELTTEYHRQCPGAFLIAEETSAWPKVTAPVAEGGLGFDLKENNGWTGDILGYMQLDPIFRSYHHGEITFSMVYHYSEQFSLGFTHEDVSKGKGSMAAKMPGRRDVKLLNLRALYGFMFTHPGKKLLFMEQDFGTFREWREDEEADFELLSVDRHARLAAYVRGLLKLYKENPALHELDYNPDGFRWINSISANENMLVYLRQTDKPEETLLVVCNFSPVVYKDRKIGVPFEGKYKEIFSSDAAEFGGEGNLNPRAKSSKKDECDDREDSIRITVPALGITVFKCTPAAAKTSANTQAKAKKVSTASKTKAAGTTAKSTVKAGKASAKTAAKTTEKGTGAALKEETLKEKLEKKVREEEKSI